MMTMVDECGFREVADERCARYATSQEHTEGNKEMKLYVLALHA